jgi:hypothetical protein
MPESQMQTGEQMKFFTHWQEIEGWGWVLYVALPNGRVATAFYPLTRQTR